MSGVRRFDDRYLRVGTISEGTLKPEDIRASLHAALSNLKLSKAERTVVREIGRHMDNPNPEKSPDYDTEEEAHYDVEALEEIANQHIPDYTYYGTAEGDGALIGVWVDWDALNDAIHDKTVGQAKDLSMIPTEGDCEHVLITNDHGNATLYRRVGAGRRGYRWVEVWSLV